MRCPACGGENPPGKRFCRNCGWSLAVVCPACRANLEPEDQFCGDCGASVTTPAPTAGSGAAVQPVQATPTAERRLCSVLFVDLVGFTPFAEKRDPEETRELLSDYFVRAQAIVSNYGGTVEKFIGDAVMAIWGAPVANEDDAERSVRAALDIVASVAELGTKSDMELAAWAGVVTGKVAITVGKVSEGMVIGDTVNTASRIQSVSPPGCRPRRQGHLASGLWGGRLQRVRRAQAKGQGRACPCLACGKGRGPTKRRRSHRAPRAPLRRTRRGATPRKGAPARHRTGEEGASRLGERHPRHRQEPPLLGAS